MSEAFNLALSLADSAINTIWGWAATAVNWVDDAWHTVSGWIWDAVQGFYRDVIWPAIEAVDWAWRQGWNLLNDFAHAIDNAAHWVFDHFIAPAWDWIVHAADTVWGWINAAIQAFYHDLILPIARDLASAWDWIVKADAFLWHGLLDVYNLIVKAWDWVLFFALNPVGNIESEARKLLHGGWESEVLDWTKGEMGSADHLADEVASWLR